jgi:hypothetical protein
MSELDLQKVSQDTSCNKFTEIQNLKNKVIQNHKNTNFCHTNGRKMNYRYYDVRTQHKKMQFAVKEFEKIAPTLKKEAITRYTRRKTVTQKEKKQRGEMFHYGIISSGFKSSILRVNEEHHLLRRKYKKDFYDTYDDNLSLVSTVDSLQVGLEAKKHGEPYLKKFLTFVHFKTFFLRMLTPETIKWLKTESDFTRVFLNLTFEELTTDFTVSRLDIIEYKLLLDYLENLFKSSIENIKPFRRIFYGMKSSFMILAVALYDIKGKYKPSGSTSYYSDSAGVVTNFQMALTHYIMFKRIFDLESKIIEAKELVNIIIMFGESDEEIIHILENFDSMLNEYIKAQIYTDFRRFFINKLIKLVQDEINEDERQEFAEDFNISLGLTAKKFLEDYTDI